MEPALGCPTCVMLVETTPIAENSRWAVHPRVPPVPVPGWTTFFAKRHVPGIAGMDDAETADLGPVLRTVQRAVLAATGAEQVYAVSINDPWEHLHVQLVPRFAGETVSWASFDKVRQLAAGQLVTDDAEHARLVALVRAELLGHPLPE